MRIKRRGAGTWITQRQWRERYDQLAEHLRPVVLRIDDKRDLVKIRPKTITEVAAMLPGKLTSMQLEGHMDRTTQSMVLDGSIKQAEKILQDLG